MLSEAACADLSKSGLSHETITAAQIRAVRFEELPNKLRNYADSYVIPYFDLDGVQLQEFQRIRLLPAPEAQRYFQPALTPNHVYLPPNLDRTYLADPTTPLFITEGEKKALKSNQEGLPTIALSGIDSWRTATFRMHLKAQRLSETNGAIAYIQVDDTAAITRLEDKVATYLADIEWRGRPVFLIFDSPQNTHVQRAQFELAMWLTRRGAEVKSIHLPENGHKLGLDDFLMENKVFVIYTMSNHARFPTQPNLKAWISSCLQSAYPKHETVLRITHAVIAHLDQHGRRLETESNDYYYFDNETATLYDFPARDPKQIRSLPLGEKIYLDTGIGSSDTNLLNHIADAFCATPTLEQVTIYHHVHATDSALYFQLTNEKLLKITAQTIEVSDNGTDSILFTADAKPIDLQKLRGLLRDQAPSAPLWTETLKTIHLDHAEHLEANELRQILTALFYLSPCFRGFRGLMLPIEQAVGEPNSGKTYLYNLRKGIITGSPSLHDSPSDLRDWHAAIAAHSPMWVADNVGNLPSQLRAQLSDEMARLTTDPNPTVTKRELYTTNALATIPIATTFAVTSIYQPFWQQDIIQRSIVFNMHAVPANERVSNWYQAQLRDRERWIADYAHVAQRFLALADEKWNDSAKSDLRLAHFEHALGFMLQAIGADHALVAKLAKQITANITLADPVMQALQNFLEETSAQRFTPEDVIAWATQDLTADYRSISQFKSKTSLSRFITAHRNDIERAFHLDVTKQHNALTLRRSLQP